jgi:tetratricopeptide (TPR) repeat protein
LPDLENHVLLLAAVELMHRTAPRDAERSHAMLTQLAQRPNCRAIASAWLAKWHVLRVVQGWATDRDAVTLLALDHVNQSLDEGAREPQALAIGGFVHAYLRKDLVTAGWMYEEAIDINPSEPMAWLFSATRSAYLGQGREAERAAERALGLSPLDPLRHFFDSLAGTAMLASGQWLRSLELSQRSIRANRTHASSWRTMTYALVMLDRMDEARESVRQLRVVDPGYSVAAFRERFPGRDGPMVAPWADALQLAGLPA